MLLTKAIEKKIPGMRGQRNQEDPVAYVKIFDPSGRYTFYGTEYSKTEREFYGFCISALGPDCSEWGYSSLTEMEGVKNRFGLGLERDLHFEPKPMSQALKERGYIDELRRFFPEVEA